MSNENFDHLLCGIGIGVCILGLILLLSGCGNPLNMSETYVRGDYEQTE